MNQFAKFARVLESFTPDQVQKLSNASTTQMQQLHEAEDADSELDAADGDPISNGNDNLVDAAQSDNNDIGGDSGNDDGDISIEKSNDDATMTVTPTGPNKDQEGAVIEVDVTNDSAGTAIVIDHSDSNDMDMHQLGIMYDFVGSPPCKSTALSANIGKNGFFTLGRSYTLYISCFIWINKKKYRIRNLFPIERLILTF